MRQLFSMRGKEQDTVDEVRPGDIAAVAELRTPTTGDVLGTHKDGVHSLDGRARSPRPSRCCAVAIRAKSQGRRGQARDALHRLLDEDPALRLERNAETHQTLLWGMGETHCRSRSTAARKFGVEVETDDVRVPYRETITGEAEARGRSRSRAAVTGSSASRAFRVEPLSAAAASSSSTRSSAAAIPRQFIPAVEKGVLETDGARRSVRLPGGRRAGHVLRRQVPLRRQLGDGLQDRGSIGLQEAIGKADPVLLEPVSELVVIVPEATRATSWATSTEARPHPGLGVDGRGEVEIVATVPTSETLRYAIDLRSMTGGRGPVHRRTRTTTRFPRTSSSKVRRARTSRISDVVE